MRERHYVFYVRRNNDLYDDKIICDMLYEVKSFVLMNDAYVGKNPHTVLTKLTKLLKDEAIAEQKLGVTRQQVDEDASSVRAMSMRARMNNNLHGAFVVRVPEDTELGFDEMDNILQSKTPDELREFLASAKIDL